MCALLGYESAFGAFDFKLSQSPFNSSNFQNKTLSYSEYDVITLMK